jgi:O-antigen ligase
MHRPRSLRILELALYAYLITIPFGATLQFSIRQLIFLTILLAVVVYRLTPCEENRTPLPYRQLLLLAAFSASHITSLVLSTNPSLSLASSLYAPIAMIVFLVTQDIATTPRAFRNIAIVLTGVIGLLSLDTTCQFLTHYSLLGGQTVHDSRARGATPNPNDIGIISILFPFLLALLSSQERKWGRVLALLALPLAIAAVMVSQSRNAWLGLLVGLTCTIVLSNKRTIGITVLSTAGLLFGVALVFDLGDVRDRIATLTRIHHDGRVGAWHVAWQMFVESPLVGKGVHVFEDFYPVYLAKVSMPAWYRPEVQTLYWVHNIYLEILAERGVFGLIAFLALVSVCGVRLVKCFAQSGSHEQRLYSTAVASSGITFLTMGIFDLTFLKDWVSLLFWLLAGLAARLPDAFISVDDIPPKHR